MMTLIGISLLHAWVAFFPPALTFPENPNSIDSPLAWHPLSTGIGKLPPASLRAWWDASKLNANDIYWGYPTLYTSAGNYEGEVIYRASGTQGNNVINVINTNNFLDGANYPGILLQIETDANKQIYEVVNVINGNSFTVKPTITATFSSQALYVAQILKWTDGSGNREHMGFWPVTDTHTPSIYLLDGNSGKTYLNGDIHIYGGGKFYFTGLTENNNLLLFAGENSTYGPIAVRELMIGNHALTDAERIEVEGYLAWKWGSVAKLPLQHPYASVAPYSSWSPTSFGDALDLWLDANQGSSLFSDAGCTVPVLENGNIGCWRDLSVYQRHFYHQGTYHNTYSLYDNKPSVLLSRGILQHSNLAWMNNQNLFIVMVLDRKPREGTTRGTARGPLRIDDGFMFPYPLNTCIGGTSGYTNISPGLTPYFSQRSTFLLQGNARNRPFYQPYFFKAVKSSLTTRSPPTYLHNQPYILAVVADFLTLPSSNVLSAALLGTILPNFFYNHNIYKNSYIVFGGSKSIPNRIMLDQGWAGVNYQTTLTAGPAVYMLWHKDPLKPPVLTINGVPDTLDPSSVGSLLGFLNIHTDQPNMFAMGIAQQGGTLHLTGTIYEAMVLTGPKLKYGHQRLIEGYLAWKWGLQHKLPRSHSYRRVPPAR